MSSLKAELDHVCAGFHGRMGYYIKNLQTGEVIGNRQEEPFPSASTIKTAIMVEVVNQIESGRLKWTDPIAIPNKSKRSVSMWTGFLEEGTKVNIDGLTNLMMNVSDNTAAILLADKVGIDNIETRMNSWGCANTACTIHVPAKNVRLTRLHEQFANMGVTSPSDMGRILERIFLRTAARSKSASERMLRIMSHEYWDDYFTSQIPPGIYVCSKVGALERSRSDIAIIYGPTPYVLTAYTDNALDKSWGTHNEGQDALRAISRIAWNRLEPTKPYRAPENSEEWYPTGGGVE